MSAMPVMVTEQMIDRAVSVFKVRTHAQPAVRPEKWDAYDRAAVRELLEVALAPRDSQAPNGDPS